MIPASAASMGPRNEVLSHGWTTIVFAAGTLFARVINLSYLEPGGSDWANRMNRFDLFDSHDKLLQSLALMPLNTSVLNASSSVWSLSSSA